MQRQRARARVSVGLMVLASGLVGLGAPAWGRSVPQEKDAALAACDETRTPFAQVLGRPAEAGAGRVSAPAAGAAEAVWLDAERLHWPGQPADASVRYRLLHAPEGGLVLQAGAALPASPSGPLLLLPAPPLASAEAARWRHLAPGAALRLAEGLSREAQVALHRGELQLVRVDAQDRLLAATRVQAPAALDALFWPAAQEQALGVWREGRFWAGRLWAPTARAVEVCLYPAPGAPPQAKLPAQFDAASGAWSWRQEGMRPGALYTYLVTVWVPGQGWVRQRVTDPYSWSLNANSQRSALLDLGDADLKPAGWDAHRGPNPGLALHELLVYELHVRDFSLRDRSVRADWRGKYLGFTDPRSTGMRHLARLAAAGVTDLHLLPVFDFATVPEQGCREPALPPAAPDSEAPQAAVMQVAAQDCFNWGYDPLHFNAPEGSYATDAQHPGVRVREFRQMVMALHRAGLRVGMDMVYNHTSAAGQHRHAVLDRIVPGYYQRLNAKGEVERSTCCDNTATEHRMMARLMSDSLLAWTQHYKLDSYRFDLMGHQPREAMLDMRKRLRKATGRHIHFIGEGWNFGEVANGARFVQASQLSLAGDGIGTFSDRARDALRGGSFGSIRELMQSRGWVNGLLESGSREQQLQAADRVRLGLAGTLQDFVFENADGVRRAGRAMDYGGQPAGYAAQPGEAVAYVENHDNHTLFDANVLKMPPGSRMDERIQAQTVASAAVLWSQGIPYVHAGQDMLRSKSLDRNSYDSGDAFNRYDPALQHNGFGVGLPPQPDNGRDWEALRPLLREITPPSPAQLRQAHRAFLDLLRVRASSSLFRLPTSQDVQQRLRFLNTGPQQDPALVVAELDGRDWPRAGFARLLLVLNAAANPRELELPAPVGGAWRLHPVLARTDAGDARLRQQARWAKGRMRVPARSASVWVP